MPRQQRAVSSSDAKIQGRAPFPLDAVATGGSEIEVVQDTDLRKVAEDEAFMNEIVHIRFINNGDQNAPREIELAVNTAGRTGKMGAPTEDYPEGKPGVAARGGKTVRKGFKYGIVYQVPRFLVEAAAHAKVVALRQVQDNPMDPASIRHIEEPRFFYPFEVVRDDNPKGRAWLNKVLSDPA